MDSLSAARGCGGAIGDASAGRTRGSSGGGSAGGGSAACCGLSSDEAHGEGENGESGEAEHGTD